MFLDNLSKKTLNIIGIVSVLLATVLIIVVIVVPILLKRILKKDYIEKCNPSMNNTNIWASFPGELKSKLLHTFAFVNYENEENNEYKVNYKTTITFEEQVKYTNFSKEDNTIYFLNNRSYKNIPDKSQNEDTSIRSINLGLFEALETMSYPPLYKIGIDSIHYLKKKFFLEPEVFIKELFTYQMRVTLTEEDIIQNIIPNLPQRKKEQILDSNDIRYKKYSLNTSSGFFEWVKILGSKEQISNATWLNDLFELTEDEIDSILLNQEAYLIQELAIFNKNLSEKFKCEDKCGEELLYKQLINSEVISSLFPKVINYKELNNYLGVNYYPFDITPEMTDFFINDYKNQKEHKTNYQEVAPSKEQLEKFIKNDGKYCLLSLENSLNILHINKTADNKKDIKYFDDLTYDNVNFLTEYFYKYLPSIFLFPEKQTTKNTSLEIDDINSIGLLSKTVSNFLPKIAEKTFNKISHIDIISYLEKKMAFVQMKKILQDVELEEICPIIMQKALNDFKKVIKVCSDENVNLIQENSLYQYIQLYYCQEETKDEKKCNNTLSDYLKKIIYISDSEISSLVSRNSFIEKIVLSTKDSLIEKYNCPGKCDNDYLLKLQYAKANVTRNPPSPVESADSLRGWFPELEDDYEIIKIKEKHQNLDPFIEQDVYWIVDSLAKSDDIYDINNANSYMNKIKFEKEFSKALINKPEESSLYKLIKFLLDIYIFNGENKNNSLLVNYPSIDDFLQGNSIESQYWIDYLRSGNYYENFKPKIEKVTKFDFGFDFNTKEQKNLELDYLGISTRTAEHNKRRIEKMNNLLTLNIKKEDYDVIKDTNIKLNFPLYNFEKLLGGRIFSDGFQYDNTLEVIYYYDLISSRPLRFNRKEDVKYKDKVECKKYYLDFDNINADINENFDLLNKNALLTQKVNKPFELKVENKQSLNDKYTDGQFEDNYICVDPISDMVIDSKMNFMYYIETRKYSLINKEITQGISYPLFHYQRNYEVDVDSYEEQFPGVTEYYENSNTLIIVGVIFIVIFTAFAIVAFVYLNKKIKKEKSEDIQNSLIPMGPELVTNVDENKNRDENDNNNN